MNYIILFLGIQTEKRWNLLTFFFFFSSNRSEKWYDCNSIWSRKNKKKKERKKKTALTGENEIMTNTVQFSFQFHGNQTGEAEKIK